MASGSSSESEFDGFNVEEVQSAIEKDRIMQEKVQQIIDGESDINISSDESQDLSESEGEDEVCPMRNLLANGKWKEDLTRLNLPAFVEQTGVTHNLNPDARPIDYIFWFLPQEFFEILATETNRYAEQKGADPRWSPTNADEMCAFESVNIFMGVRQFIRECEHFYGCKTVHS
jgi:hypothetical protein